MGWAVGPCRGQCGAVNCILRKNGFLWGFFKKAIALSAIRSVKYPFVYTGLSFRTGHVFYYHLYVKYNQPHHYEFQKVVEAILGWAA